MAPRVTSQAAMPPSPFILVNTFDGKTSIEDTDQDWQYWRQMKSSCHLRLDETQPLGGHLHQTRLGTQLVGGRRSGLRVSPTTGTRSSHAAPRSVSRTVILVVRPMRCMVVYILTQYPLRAAPSGCALIGLWCEILTQYPLHAALSGCYDTNTMAL